MKIGPRYKIARRLGAPIFEKTQTPKYAASLARKEKSRGFTKPKSEFGLQLQEKQKARFSYGITEKQFKNYVNKALASKGPVEKLYTLLETRLDNAIYRAGLLKTRAQARQAAAHGHFLVNGRRVTIPSLALREGDKVSIREGSASSPLFRELEERLSGLQAPAWLSVEPKSGAITVKGVPVYDPAGLVFDLGVVVEFYSR